MLAKHRNLDLSVPNAIAVMFSNSGGAVLSCSGYPIAALKTSQDTAEFCTVSPRCYARTRKAGVLTAISAPRVTSRATVQTECDHGAVIVSNEWSKPKHKATAKRHRDASESIGTTDPSRDAKSPHSRWALSAVL